MKRYIYHYHAFIVKPNTTGTYDFDGIIERDRPIENQKDYNQLKLDIVAKFDELKGHTAHTFTLANLSLIN